MKSKYQCPYCQYMSLRKWNLKTHVRNVHGIETFLNGSNVKPHIDQQNIRKPPCPIHSSENRSNQEQQLTFNYQTSQEEHQHGKRFKDVSTQYSENDINHSTAPYLIPSVCVCKERKPFIVYNAEVINEKNVQFRKELIQNMGDEIVSIIESNFLPLMK